MFKSKLGKAHVPHRKSTADMPAVRIATPKTVFIPTAQHIGAPATPVCKVGDEVFVGTKIAEASGFVSAPVHSSVSGTVKKIGTLLSSNGRKNPCIIIESDGNMTKDPSIAPPVCESFEQLSAAVRESGLIGLGGAGFPTAVKLDPKKIGSIDALVINAAECEPYITSDTRTMIDKADYVRRGVLTLMRLGDIKRAVIGIEENKPTAVEAMKKAFSEDSGVEISVLPSRYPQGAEKILIYNTLGRVVPEGGLPSDVGVIVMNVTSVAFLAEYLETGMPLVEKCVTVDGSAISEPKNVICPVGTTIADLCAFCGGYSSEPGKILLGGPMMGVAVYSDEHPIMKNTNAITVFDKKDAVIGEQNPCIHCGRCVSICPMGLNPTSFAKAVKLSDTQDAAERLDAAKIGLCIECGCCSYICPSRRPLVENNRLGKQMLREYKAKMAGK